MTAAILDVRPAALPGTVLARGATSDLVRLFALDRLPVHRQRLVGRWHRGADGRLACSWEPDMALFAQR
jgi:hypothetical protein